MSNIKLKICGVKTVSEAKQLKNSGIDFVGLNFIPISKRCISPETAESILGVLEGSDIKTVALFQDQPLDMVNDYANQLSFDYVQLHGNESADYASAIKLPVIKAIAVTSTATPNELIDLINNYPADYFVLDRQKQGHGDIVNLKTAKQVIAAIPDKICLAGGLNPDNLTDVLTEVHPHTIDISSGVRTNDAIDPEKVRQCLSILLKVD